MSNSTSDAAVLIAGAGPTGLVLALWLTKLGVRVRMVDKNAEAGTTSRAVAVQARTLEFYNQIGLAATVVDAGVKVEGVNLWIGGRRAAHVPLGAIGQGQSPFPYALTYPQDAHERLLIERLAALGVNVQRRTELTGLEQSADRVAATLKHADGSEEVCHAAYLVGCDGASSTVRKALAIAFPGGTYTGLFYVADVEASGPATDQEIHVDFDQADFMAVFPLAGQGRLRLIGPIRWEADHERRDLTFDDIAPRALGNLQLHVKKVNWFSTYHVHHRVASGFRRQRVLLAGDAAHVHSPVGGQGMNTGIGDAVNLAWKLAAVLDRSADESLLATYECERIGFARRLVATTDRAFTLITKRGGLARLVRTRLVPAILPVIFRIPAARRFLFRTISQTAIQYRDSSLSSGVAGDVHGGDRLPWVEIAGGQDNFAPLASLKWQVHVYGQSTPRLVQACEEQKLELRVFAWQQEMAGVGLARDALYLVRPDGYVALAESAADPDAIRNYFASRLRHR